MSIRTQKGVIRIEHAGSHTKGWRAEIIRRSGQTVRLFSDGVYGGKRSAHRAACAWYQSQVDKFPRVSRLECVSMVRRNNRSGVSGVSRWPADGRKIPGACWGAQWVAVPGDKPTRRKFSVARHGERRAKKLEIEARLDALKNL